MGREVECQWLSLREDGPPSTYMAHIVDLLTGWEPSLPAEMHDRVAAAEQRIADTVKTCQESPVLDGLRWLLLCAESLSSSVIESVHADFRQMPPPGIGNEERERRLSGDDKSAYGNLLQTDEALAVGEQDEDVRLTHILDLHETLMRHTDRPDLAGRLRLGAVWIGSAWLGPFRARFVPAPADEVPRLVDDLVWYLNSDRHTPLLQAALVHVQFESIHPFGDGNGRTGRALIHTVLAHHGLADGLPLPVSRGLLRYQRDYYDALNAYRYVGPADSPERDTNLLPWLHLLVLAYEQACELVLSAEAVLREARDRWEQATADLRSDSAARRMLPLLQVIPQFSVGDIAERLEITDAAARGGVNELQQLGIVRVTTSQKRNRRYECPTLLRIAKPILPPTRAELSRW